jgi:hypothetical protein
MVLCYWGVLNCGELDSPRWGNIAVENIENYKAVAPMGRLSKEYKNIPPTL